MKKEILPHQARVLGEKANLDAKIVALQKFIEDNGEIYSTLSGHEKNDLQNQLSTMEAYSLILKRRINRF
jgi:hypothetical protein